MFDAKAMEARALLTPARMALVDVRAMQTGTPHGLLVERAARACFRVIRSRYTKRPVMVLAGPGSNGEDGLVLAELLLAAGWPVEVMRLDSSTPFDTERHGALSACLRPTASFAPTRRHLVIDALFGAGLSRPIASEADLLIKRMAESEATVLAIDLPSGVDGATGEVQGRAAPADASVTFHRLKPGHLLAPGRDLCGEVYLSDIGIEPQAEDTDALWNGSTLWQGLLPSWPRETHKYQRSHVAVFGGPGLSGGAGRLAALTASRSGVGAVTLFSPISAATFAASRMDAIMVAAVPAPDDMLGVLSKRHDSVVIGPGLGHGEAARERVLSVLNAAVPTVLDADALTLFSDDPSSLFERLHSACVMTPHEGEFRQLFPDLEGDRLSRAQAAADRSGATVLLKGASTVIASPGALPVIDTSGSVALATAGSGDCLAGALGALLAQGLVPHAAASAAAWLHGKAGESLGLGANADALPDAIAESFDAVMVSQKS